MDVGFTMAVATSFMLRTSHLLSSEGAGFVFKMLQQVRFCEWCHDGVVPQNCPETADSFTSQMFPCLQEFEQNH